MNIDIKKYNINRYCILFSSPFTAFSLPSQSLISSLSLSSPLTVSHLPSQPHISHLPSQPPSSPHCLTSPSEYLVFLTASYLPYSLLSPLLTSPITRSYPPSQSATSLTASQFPSQSPTSLASYLHSLFSPQDPSQSPHLPLTSPGTPHLHL